MFAVFCLTFVAASSAVADPVLDLETLTGQQAEAMMNAGTLTSVQLTRAYINRIAAINKSGPGINAVTQLNADALNEAALSDLRRAQGQLMSPLDGLPVLMKDIVDVKGMYTSAGNYSLRNSFPQKDSSLVAILRTKGAVILGKTGLSEFANYFGSSQPSGYSNLTGQVLNGIDADQNPSGSSSGTGAAAAAALSALTIGTETSGSIISPSQTQGIVGLRPTVGLVPDSGVTPIAASQDTAGPMTRTVSDAALMLQGIAGPDPDSSYAADFGPAVAQYNSTIPAPTTPATLATVIPTPPPTVPDYLSALDLNFVNGKRIGYNGTLTPGTPLQQAFDALTAAGAIMVSRPVINPGSLPSGDVLAYEAHRDLNNYYAHLGPLAPIGSLLAEITDNQAHPQESLKYGNSNHTNAQSIDISPTSAASIAYNSFLVNGKIIAHAGIDRMMNNDTPSDPTDDFIGILGSVNNGARAGYPQITIPMGYNTTTRRTVNISVNGNAYDERNLLGIAYVIEQGTHLRQPASMVDPSMYRCAKTVPPEPFASRGSCNPDYDSLMAMIGGTAPVLPFSLETESAQSLQARETAGTLSAVTLTKAYLARIAMTNAEGPAIQAVRDINTNAIADATALDNERALTGPRGPLHGIPVLVDDSVDVAGMPTTGGSIALQHSVPTADSKLVAKLKAAGAIILGKTNVSEMNGVFDGNMPKGYSSLGGQVLLPSDTDVNPGGSSAGSAAATSSGLAALTVGMETGTDGAQMITPAGNAGVVALKPTVGRVSRTGILPVAKSQDSPGPIAKTVFDAAMELQAMAGSDAADPATTGAPAVPNYLTGLTTTALSGKRVAVISSSTAPYPAVLTTITGLGATTVVKTVGTPSPNPASIVPTEFKRDVNAYLAPIPGGGAKSLQDIIDYDTANPVEGLKYQQGLLTTDNAVDLTNPTTASTYATNLTTGKASNAALIDTILNNGTPADPTDDFDVIVVPSGNALVGIADRAGYPVLTVPAGFSTSTRNPIGVTFVGTAFSEDKLLDDAYAYEQASNVRGALGTYAAGLASVPSVTNPSMWRCVPGSTFFSPHECNPGDLLTTSAVGATAYPVATQVTGTVLPTLSLSLATTSASLGTFTPGVAHDYSTTIAATVTSSAATASLTATDLTGIAPAGHLVNGSFSLPQALQANGTSTLGASTAFAPLSATPLSLLTYSTPVSTDSVTIGLKQPIGATDALRTGTYSKTIMVTLATTTP